MGQEDTAPPQGAVDVTWAKRTQHHHRAQWMLHGSRGHSTTTGCSGCYMGQEDTAPPQGAVDVTWASGTPYQHM